MYDAGCRELMFGLESASQKVLKLMRKNTFVKENEQILINAKKIGIGCHTYIMTGFPNEEPEDFLETVKFVARNHKNIIDYSLGALYITDNNNIYKNQEEFNISLF